MAESESASDDAADAIEMDELRDEYPSGWRILVQHESVGYIVDALLDELPGAELTKTELADRAGVSRQSVYTHLDLLIALGVLDPVEESSPPRYRVNREAPLFDALVQLDGAVNEAIASR